MKRKFKYQQRLDDAKVKVKNSFDGATKGARSGVAYRPVSDINQSISSDLETLRGRSMGAHLNSPMAVSAFDQWVSDEIGGSAVITPTTSNDDVNVILSELWKSHERFIDVGLHLNLVGLLSVATRERRVNGEVFIRLVRRRAGALPVPMQVQIVSSRMVPMLDKTLDNGNKIKQGIEFNGNRKVAIWFTKSETNIFDLMRVPMRDVIHSYVQKFAGQVRGIPSFAPALLKESEYNSYEENELARKASQSSVVGMITRDGAEEEGLDDAGNPTDGGDEFVNFGPNKLLIGADGEGLEMNNSPDVGQNYKDFVTNSQRLVSMGGGVPVQLVTSNYDGLNDRTLRQINNSHRRKVKAERVQTTEFLIVGKMWRWFVDAAVLSGANIPNYWDNRDDLRSCRFTAEAFAYDHAVQDLNAAEKSVKLGVKSIKSFCEERGADYEQNITDKANHIALIYKICETAGITYDQYMKGQA